MRRSRSELAWLAALVLAPGCTIAPRDFFQHRDPAPLVRARSLGLGRELPESFVIPTLIEKLHDPDAVVRMTAHEELRRRTGQDFGYKPWAEPVERAPAVEAWRRWWQAHRAAHPVAAAGPSRPVARGGRPPGRSPRPPSPR